MPAISRLLALTGAAALALTACAAGADTAESEGPSPEPEMSATHEAMAEPTEQAMAEDAMESEDAMEEVEVPEELQFTTTTLAGDEFDGASLAGQDAILWVWASWCPTCAAEAPAIAAANDQLPEGVTLYGLSGNSDLESSQAFVDTHDVGDLEHLFSEDGSLWSHFGVSYQPALILINDDGTIAVLPGTTGEAGLIKAAEDLAAA